MIKIESYEDKTQCIKFWHLPFICPTDREAVMLLKNRRRKKSQLSASVHHSYHEPIYSAANSSERFVILFDTVHTKFFKPSNIKMMNAYNDLTINTKISYNTIKWTTCQCTWKLCQEHVPFCFSDLTHETAIYVTWLCKEVWKSEWKVYCNRLKHVVLNKSPTVKCSPTNKQNLLVFLFLYFFL